MYKKSQKSAKSPTKIAPQTYACGAMVCLLQFFRCSGVEENVTDVGNTGNVHNQTVKANTKATVRNRTVLSEVKVLRVSGNVHSACFHSCYELVVVCLSFTATNKLTNAGNKQVGSRNGFAVVVLLHIEGLDILGIVDNEYGLLKDLLGQPTLVLALELSTPFGSECKVCTLCLFEQLDRIGVLKNLEIGGGQKLELFAQTLLKELLKEVDFGGAVFKNVANDELDIFFNYVLRL